MSQHRSSSAKEVLPPPASIWRFGFVHVGMPVWWRPNGDRNENPIPATVMEVGERTLALKLIDPTYDKLISRQSVRHVDEPGVSSVSRDESGGWEHTPSTVRLYSKMPELAIFPEQAEWMKLRDRLETKEQPKSPPPPPPPPTSPPSPPVPPKP